MRAFWENIERGSPQVRRAEMDTALAAHEWEALVRAGILRPEGDAAMVEISLSDLVRALRVLYGVQARGLSTTGFVPRTPLMIGWAPEPDGDREVFLIHYPVGSFAVEAYRTRRTLLLLPTAKNLTPALRAKHSPQSFIGVDVLDEAITIRDGHLARASAEAPFAPDLSRLTRAPAPLPAPSPALPSAPALSLAPIPGAARWSHIHVRGIDASTVRVDIGDKSYRRTYVDLGMAHAIKRTPTRLWLLLLALCEQHGTFHGRDFGGADATKKLVSRLGRHLQKVFGLGEPAFHPYRPKEGWRACFQASPRGQERGRGVREED